MSVWRIMPTTFANRASTWSSVRTVSKMQSCRDPPHVVPFVVSRSRSLTRSLSDLLNSMSFDTSRAKRNQKNGILLHSLTKLCLPKAAVTKELFCLINTFVGLYCCGTLLRVASRLLLMASITHSLVPALLSHMRDNIARLSASRLLFCSFPIPVTC